MIKRIFSLFGELIFTRREEYDFKSKHFKPGKVIFLTVVILMFIYASLVTSALIRTGVKYMELTEKYEKLIEEKKVIKPPQMTDKIQPKRSSDSQKPSMENQDE